MNGGFGVLFGEEFSRWWWGFGFGFGEVVEMDGDGVQGVGRDLGGGLSGLLVRGCAGYAGEGGIFA